MPADKTKQKGKVYIIGAGPGDPELITVKGLRCIREADVLIYDHLVSEEILSHAKESIRLIYVGKQGGDHTLSQDEINRRLVEEAGQGKIVARVKGGDPFIFGRGGEEAEVLAKAGIPFEIVSGVTSAIAVPSYAGIPLTHRGYTSTVAFVTGHEDPTKEKSDIDWGALAGIGTLVFLMGVKNLPKIVSALIAHGKDPETPAALIRWGTTADQETLTGTLANIAERAEEKKVLPPAIFVVGRVVDLRAPLDWFEQKPLFGKGVVITRPEPQAAEMRELLWQQGARTIAFPTIRIVPPESWQALDEALKRLESYRLDHLYKRQRRPVFLQAPAGNRPRPEGSEGNPDLHDRAGDGLHARSDGHPGRSDPGFIHFRGRRQGFRETRPLWPQDPAAPRRNGPGCHSRGACRAGRRRGRRHRLPHHRLGAQKRGTGGVHRSGKSGCHHLYKPLHGD